MAKRKMDVRMRTYGVHTKWDSETKQLPRLLQAVTQVPALVDIEFGFVVNIRGAKNQLMHYCIDHPGILNSDGKRRDPFDGSVYVKTNDWDFYLGDTVWDPIDDKLGPWKLWLEIDGHVIAEKKFLVFDPRVA